MSISVPKPKEERIRIGSYKKPTKRPVAPRNSKTIINNPSFSSLNLLNSSFIWGLIKYEIVYPKNETLDIKTHIFKRSINNH
jgi:hypothetical protein